MPCPFRALSDFVADGGGAKGFYTLGVLKEIEAMLSQPLYQCFDLIFGTSTGAIIAALVALGSSVDDIQTFMRFTESMCRRSCGEERPLESQKLSRILRKRSSEIANSRILRPGSL